MELCPLDSCKIFPVGGIMPQQHTICTVENAPRGRFDLPALLWNMPVLLRSFPIMTVEYPEAGWLYVPVLLYKRMLPGWYMSVPSLALHTLEYFQVDGFMQQRYYRILPGPSLCITKCFWKLLVNSLWYYSFFMQHTWTFLFRSTSGGSNFPVETCMTEPVSVKELDVFQKRNLCSCRIFLKTEMCKFGKPSLSLQCEEHH